MDLMTTRDAPDHDTAVARKMVSGRPMRLLETAVYRGPHLFSHRPMIRLQVDLGALEQWPTHRLDGFSDRLTALLPGLGQHGCRCV